MKTLEKWKFREKMKILGKSENFREKWKFWKNESLGVKMKV